MENGELAFANVTGYAHRGVFFKTTFLSAMQFAKASGASHGAQRSVT